MYSELRYTCNEVEALADKPRHLFEIHSARPALWPVLAGALLKYDWSVKDTHYYVEQSLTQITHSF